MRRFDKVRYGCKESALTKLLWHSKKISCKSFYIRWDFATVSDVMPRPEATDWEAHEKLAARSGHCFWALHEKCLKACWAEQSFQCSLCHTGKWGQTRSSGTCKFLEYMPKAADKSATTLERPAWVIYPGHVLLVNFSVSSWRESIEIGYTTVRLPSAGKRCRVLDEQKRGQDEQSPR